MTNCNFMLSNPHEHQPPASRSFMLCQSITAQRGSASSSHFASRLFSFGATRDALLKLLFGPFHAQMVQSVCVCAVSSFAL